MAKRDSKTASKILLDGLAKDVEIPQSDLPYQVVAPYNLQHSNYPTLYVLSPIEPVRLHRS